MRKLNEMIVLIRGGGSVGSAIAQRLAHSHFRVCITETSSPTAIRRGVSLSEAIYENQKVVEDINGEKSLPTLEQIYKAWRNNQVPVLADPEISVRALLKPDVLINAMMLKRETNIHMKDAPLVIGIGPGFIAGGDVHLIVESNPGRSLGKVIIEGQSEPEVQIDPVLADPSTPRVIKADENGVFTTTKNIGDSVQANDVIGNIDDIPVKAPIGGVLCGILRNDMKVLANTRLAAVDPVGTKDSCLLVSDYNRAIAGGVLEAIMLSLNIPDDALQNM
jgi:xanthine dehydrogenase accessory factor